MLKTDFDGTKINNSIKNALKNHDLDFCVLLSAGINKQISANAEYTPPSKYITLTPALQVQESFDIDKYYYGVAPNIDGYTMIKLISQRKLSSVNELNAFISANAKSFMLHCGQEKYLLPIAKYIVVSLSHNFGIRIKLNNSHIINAIKAVRTIGKSFIIQKENILTIRGCPSKEIIELLMPYRFSVNDNFIWCESEAGLSILDIYNDEKNIRLINGDVFYSGVLLKALSLTTSSEADENKDVVSICFNFERSTYATVFTLDNVLFDHPLLDDCRTEIIEFLKFDDSCKTNLKERIQKCSPATAENLTEYINAINSYLSVCYNVNQIGVTGNIYTADNRLILGKRSAASIDSEKIYPSVNGNAEIADAAVQFYKRSVYEDFPKIYLGSPRIDFNKELNRETYAELKINTPAQNWECIGIVLSGNIPEKDSSQEYKERFRRFHFNVICEQNVSERFEEILSTSSTATESYENKNIYGVRLHCYNSVFHHIANGIKFIFKSILDSKDFAESLSVILLLVLSVSNGTFGEINNIQSILSVLIACIIIVSTLENGYAKIKKFIKTNKYKINCSIRKKMTYEDTDLILSTHVLKKSDYHPVAYTALRLYFDNRCYKCFFNNDEE